MYRGTGPDFTEQRPTRQGRFPVGEDTEQLGGTATSRGERWRTQNRYRHTITVKSRDGSGRTVSNDASRPISRMK
jgi:hypothetical protein